MMQIVSSCQSIVSPESKWMERKILVQPETKQIRFFVEKKYFFCRVIRDNMSACRHATENDIGTHAP